MIRTYFLSVTIVNNTEVMAGINVIHDCLVETTDQAMVRRVIMGPTDAEHALLAALAASWNEATIDERDRYYALVTPLPPDPDYDRACEILSNPTIPIPATELAELVRIFGKRLGYDF